MLSVKDINLLQAQNDGLIKQNKDLQAENIKLNAIIDSYQPKIQALKDENERLKEEVETRELKDENERLKEEVEIRDNLVEHFRKEAINWAKISNDCIKDIEKYKQTLQEIKEMAKRGFAICDDDCGNAIRYTQILDIINKAEEEWNL